MSKLSCRECYFLIKVKVKHIDSLIERVKSAIREMGIPPGYDIRIYKNVYACCEVSGVGVIIEVTGPEEERIRAIDLRAVSKILEICEKEGLEHHTLEPLEVV